MSKRYKVIEESLSGHCCFDFTIIDSSRKEVMNDGSITDDDFRMCECFERAEADLICNALNAMEGKQA